MSRAAAILEKMPKYMWHTAPSSKTKEIRRDGLKSRRGKVYLWDNEENAKWFMSMHEEDGEDMTMWRVDVSGLKLERDPETEDMNHWSTRFDPGEEGGGWMHDGDIPPERLRRMY